MSSYMRDGPDGLIESTRTLAELTGHLQTALNAATWDVVCADCPSLEPARRPVRSSPHVAVVAASTVRAVCCRTVPAEKPSLWRRLTTRRRT
jgi:hypothetical protein